MCVLTQVPRVVLARRYVLRPRAQSGSSERLRLLQKAEHLVQRMHINERIGMPMEPLPP